MGKLQREAERILAKQENKKTRKSKISERFKSRLCSIYSSRPMKYARKALFYTFFTSAVAIGGANLGTYFSYKYHNYEYRNMPNRTRLYLTNRVEENSITKAAQKAARIRIVGSKEPEEAKVDILIINDKGKTYLETNYTLVWNTNKGMKKRDEEIMNIKWEYDPEKGGFIPYEAQTRYHYKNVAMPLSGRVPAIVIQNPAHTPGIPGAKVSYQGPIKIVDVFTLFSAEKWAGSSLSCGLPHEFRAMDMRLKARVEVLNKVDTPVREPNNLK
jgi:hypothetical protein